ncbi:MAG: hypothetical protein U0441_02040 [Polyangiaceae bacterium]
MNKLAALFAVVFGVLLFSNEASATVVCTVSGYYRVEPQDPWYCDTDYLNDCSNWREVDLDKKRGASAAPLRHMRMAVKDSAGNLLDATATDSNGWYAMSATLPGTSCAGQTVEVINYFERVHEDDHNAASPRVRFEIVNSNDTLYYGALNITLTGLATAQSRTYLATETALNARIANIYYSMNSTVTEVATWSTRLNNLFIGTPGVSPLFLIRYWSANTALLWGARSLTVPYSDYAASHRWRHELGHTIHNTIHNGQQLMADPATSCMSYNLMGAGGHNDLSCEYGFTATKEGLASFFAMRSLTSNDTEVFFCSCNPDAGIGDGQDVCSKRAAAMLGASPDADRIDEACTGGAVAGVGDRYSNGTATCARVLKDRGCNCASSTCEDAFRLSSGWQNENQVMRFLWDVVDSSDDGGLDQTDESITSLVALMEAMPCSSALHADGTCNEPNNTSGGVPSCTPASDSALQSAPHQGTRHSYNVWDIAEMVPGDQGNERTLNCVQGATD